MKYTCDRKFIQVYACQKLLKKELGLPKLGLMQKQNGAIFWHSVDWDIANKAIVHRDAIASCQAIQRSRRGSTLGQGGGQLPPEISTLPSNMSKHPLSCGIV